MKRRPDELPELFVEWAEPPDTRSRSWRYDGVVATLKTEPGRFARIAKGLSTDDAGIIQAALRRHGCEARSKKAKGGTDVWARWPG